ncbi:hypothetical protein VNO77_22296 [Canavalia gladiata]|uniref:Uncharacterized protein n=1 Tax=Canavalia gladiata TaxID=3824 RepID=A0AAN9L5T5_CANGL
MQCCKGSGRVPSLAEKVVWNHVNCTRWILVSPQTHYGLALWEVMASQNGFMFLSCSHAFSLCARTYVNGRALGSLGGQNSHGQTEGKLPQMDYAAAPKSAPGTCGKRVISAGVDVPRPLTRARFGEWNNDSLSNRIRVQLFAKGSRFTYPWQLLG